MTLPLVLLCGPYVLLGLRAVNSGFNLVAMSPTGFMEQSEP